MREGFMKMSNDDKVRLVYLFTTGQNTEVIILLRKHGIGCSACQTVDGLRQVMDAAWSEGLIPVI